ncbi:uncharacterized protein LY89DRAFT_770560 [Mollisia scopiformis]|uniref:Heterokaryon incompatibility domain-containing protein n=1 Tax=Mollisia scopiformis TaxID=149040 RepID=A0A194XM39_MOLSC|nr:uncharacterized protein LY89DRAFT_770560 [Mollisia scopiformis]KUJ21310.1 hypothetical protein LY89DRAFT_770560 [Mollisia scopiformis]
MQATILSALYVKSDLEDAPNYKAISYAWGNPANKVNVHCDGKLIVVTRNLRDALLRLRFKDKARLLWADAICINQSDDVEKGSQVKIMQTIYGNATGVCVWLGCGTAEMQPAFKLIDDIVSHESSTSADRTELPDPTSRCWSTLGAFFSAAWFTGLWVVQEVYNHACTVFCGEHEMRWQDLVLIAEFLWEDPLNAYPGSRGDSISILQINSAGHSHATSGVFDRFRHFNCSDQRDKVYALLSFPPLSSLRPLIQPDYSKSVAEVFEEATVRIITSSQNLGLLSSLEHDCEIEDEDWPTWVPRWDRSRNVQVLHKYSSGRVHSSLPRMHHQPRILTLEGVRISTSSWCGMVIEIVGATARYSESQRDPLKQPLQELLNTLPKVTHPNDPLLLRIGMTLIVGLDLQSKCPPLDLAQFRLDFLAYLRDILPSLYMLCSTHHLSQLLMEQAQVGDAPRFYAAAFRGSKNKRIFCMQNGEFGIGPRAARAGDLVVLLYGSNAPSVLRPKGEYYQFVGECYVYQHMHGEAIEMAAEKLLPVEKFELR